jgi:pimeloyl-ACP methyl ester carboxylesterase
MSARLEPMCTDLRSGARIEYLEAGSGAPVVYFHGVGSVSRNAELMSDLAERYRVLAPLRPAYGGSTGASDSAREEAEVMAEFICQIVGGPAHVIAESAGGAVGCWLAIVEPSLVESLVLVAPTGFVDDTNVEVRERLGEIASPTLVLWGTADEIVPAECGQIFIRNIPNSYRILIYAAAHSLAVSARRQFVALVSDFIRRGERFVVAEP